jgi:hypothetical protein
MGNLIGGIEFLNIPMTVAIALVSLFLILQIIGELLEFKGKIVPEFLKVRKYFKRKKNEKEESTQTLKEVRQLLSDVNCHYSADNIAKRDQWMLWVNGRADTYDSFIKEITKKFADVTNALDANTKMTEEMFVQSSRDRIIDFAAKVSDENSAVSREEFNRIFKVYDRYESFCEEHDIKNGEIDIAYKIITESYESHTKHHSFVEDHRGYN